MRNQDEEDEIFRQIETDKHCHQGFWIGLSKVKSQWSDQSHFDSGSWNLKQPNKWDENQCVEMSIPSRVWNNDGCEQAKPFICYDGKIRYDDLKQFVKFEVEKEKE